MPKSNVSPWPPVGWAPIPTLREIACKRFRSQRTSPASAIARDLSFPSRGCQSENLFEKKIGNLFIRICVQAEDDLKQNMQQFYSEFDYFMVLIKLISICTNQGERPNSTQGCVEPSLPLPPPLSRRWHFQVKEISKAEHLQLYWVS